MQPKDGLVCLQRMLFMPAKQPPITLQRLLVAAFLLVLLPTIVVQAWFSYRTLQESSVTFQEQLASSVSARVFDKVLQFFEVPHRVLGFNAELFRAGELHTAKSEAMQRNFLLQLGQQPMLTFLSIGTAAGDYFSASRPPLGEDRALRLLQATETEGRSMSLYRVNANNQRGDLNSVGNAHFDARTRPWFRAAVGYNSARWYPAYRYAIDDPEGAFDAMGIGMSAPLYNAAGDFVGVVTADVALVQLSELLASITKNLGGTAFLFDEGGELLATSTLEPLYELQNNKTSRIKGRESSNPLIRLASEVIREKNQDRGRTEVLVDGESYLLDWWEYPLPDGPSITIANMLPQSQFDAPSRGLFLNIALFSAATLVASLILLIFVSKWIARPLVRLGEWATQLGRGEWHVTQHSASPIAEVQSLSSAFRFMAESLKYQTDNLEKQVAARTIELEMANIELGKRSRTDGLTGVANRRHFDEVLISEWARARRAEEPLALIMLDVDAFKSYNDFYGHQPGDNCLRSIANILQRGARRPSDLAARYGGEEFAFITCVKNSEEALALAEKLRQQIEQLAIPHELSSIGIVTASIGVAMLIPDDSNSIEQLIERADKALYRAKERGRNRVELAQD